MQAIPEIHVEHVGSTAIPCISAKPIIDITIGIDAMKKFNSYKNKLQKLGYKYHANRGSMYNKFFTKGPEDCRTVYIHLVKYQGAIWHNYIHFRDTLRNHKQLVLKYQKLKTELATNFKNRDDYTRSKAFFIKKIIKSFK